MSLRIGINADSSTIDGDLSVLDEMLARFLRAGFTDAEIPVHGADCIAGGKLVKKRVDDVKLILEKYPLSYTVHGPDTLNLADDRRPEDHALAFRAAVDFTAQIGAKILVYHGSLFRAGSGNSDERKDEISRLKDAAEYAAGRGVVVAAENIFRQDQGEVTYRTDPRKLAEIVEEVKSPHLGICYDFGHAFISSCSEGFDLAESLGAVLPHLVHVHIHDNFGRPELASGKTAGSIDKMFLGAGDLHLPPGWGTIPYEKLFPLFAAAYRGIFMLEIQPRFRDRYEESALWVKRMARQ